jgi:hypothetical protein
MSRNEPYSRFRRHNANLLLIKLNHSALSVLVGDDKRPLRSWLELARTSLKRVLLPNLGMAHRKADSAMNATASDLKSAMYITFVRPRFWVKLS